MNKLLLTGLSILWRVDYDEEMGKLIIDESGHVKSVKRFRIILEGCLIALGLPTRIAHEANI